MRVRFTIRHLLLAVLSVGLAIGWIVDHKRLSDKIAEITPQIQPACTIEGSVTYADTGKPVAGVRVYAQAISSFAGARDSGGDTKTDDQGHFRFVNLAPGNYNIFLEADGWTASAIESLPVVAGQAVKEANLQLVKGSIIKGRVVDEKTGNGVSYAHSMPMTIGVYGPARPKSTGAVDATRTDSNGKFEFRVPPGKNFPYIMSIAPQYIIKGSEYMDDGIVVEDGKTSEIEFVVKQTP